MRHLVPLMYMQATRLPTKRTVVARLLFEFVPQLCIVWAAGGREFLPTAGAFALGVVGFLSLYEIGYLNNDYYAERRERSPAERHHPAVGSGPLLTWSLVRLATFAAVAWGLATWAGASARRFVVASAATFAVFMVHNLLPESRRLVTFGLLTLARFCVPLVAFLTASQLGRLLPAVLLNYTLYRLVIYACRKGYWNRSLSPGWPVWFFGAVLPVTVSIGWLMRDARAPLLTLYYLALFGSATWSRTAHEA